MSYSRCKKKEVREKEARERKRKERGGGQRELRKWTDRDFLSVRVSYRLPVLARLRASRMFPFIPRFSFLQSCRALSPQQYTFFFRYFRAGFSLYFCRFSLWHSPKCIRPVGSVVDKCAINGFYSVSNWKSIGCRRCHKMFREIVYTDDRSGYVSSVSSRRERTYNCRDTLFLIVSTNIDVWILFLIRLNV